MDEPQDYNDGEDGPDEPNTPQEPSTPQGGGEDLVKVIATLMDGETVEFMVPRGSTLEDLSRMLHLPEPGKKVATDEDDRIITPDFAFTEDVTYITYVVSAKGG